MRRALPRPGRPSRRARRLTLAVSGGAALVLATTLVWHTAYAAFTVTTYPFSSSFSRWLNSYSSPGFTPQ